jgi:aspartyl/asparaginyl-tRNA synthetase
MLGDVPNQGGSHECRHTKEVVMSAPEVSPEAFADAMQQKTEEFLRQVMASVNAAPDGDWIAGSEEQVRNLSADFRREVFQQALQMRADAAEAAFPPSAGPGQRQASGQ